MQFNEARFYFSFSISNGNTLTSTTRSIHPSDPFNKTLATSSNSPYGCEYPISNATEGHCRPRGKIAASGCFLLITYRWQTFQNNFQWNLQAKLHTGTQVLFLTTPNCDIATNLNQSTTYSAQLRWMEVGIMTNGFPIELLYEKLP